MVYFVKTSKRTVKAYRTRKQAERYIEEHPQKSYTILELDIDY